MYVPNILCTKTLEIKPLCEIFVQFAVIANMHTYTYNIHMFLFM